MSTTLPRAFLSHSSKDKPFVSEVATRLGRRFCVYDDHCFHAGDDLLAAIDKHVAASSLIVLFASKEALDSEWVNLELAKAQEQRLAEATYRGLALGVGTSVHYTDLPKWLQSARFESALNPEHAARIVQNHIEELIRNSRGDVFVGRRDEIAQFETEVASSREPPRLYSFYGLHAVGRRTLLSRVSRDMLGFQRHVEIALPTGETIQDMAVTLGSHVEPYISKEDFQRKTRLLKKQQPGDAARYAAGRINDLASAGVLPVFLDEGGAAERDGSLTTHLEILLEEASKLPAAHAALISVRRPELTLANLPPSTTLHVKPLTDSEVLTLLQLLLRRASVTFTKADVETISEHCKGHPASVHYAARIAQRYGAPSVARDVRKVVDFRSNFFLSYLKTQGLSKESQSILTLLAGYRALPLRVLGPALGLSAEALSKAMIEAMDLSLVYYSQSGLYTLAHPIEDAVVRTFGFADIDHATVASELQSYLDEAEPEERLVELSRALFRATRYSFGSRSDWALSTVAELLKIGKDLYHDRQYERGIPIFRELLLEDPKLIEARTYLVRALIQNDQHSDAANELSFFQKEGLLKDYYFLYGFMLRKQGKSLEAREQYLEAEKRGRRDLPLLRELSLCAATLNNYEEAAEWIERARRLDASNRRLVDLSIQVAVETGRLADARKWLTDLERVDRPEFYWYRRSTVEYAEQKWKDARSSAKKAVAMSKQPSFAMLSHLAKCSTDQRDFSEAAIAIKRLEREYPRRFPDIKRVLWCRWELAQSNFANAEGHWKQIGDKSIPIHRTLRLEIVRGRLRERLTGEERQRYELERDQLQASIDVDTSSRTRPTP